MSASNEKVKKLVTNLFTYVKEIKSRLDKPVLDENRYDWLLNLEELPDHPYIFKKSTDEYFIKVKRPKVIECPRPPDELIEWLKPSWKFIDKELDYLKSKNIEHEDGTIETLRIEDQPGIIEKIKEWEIVRNAWKEAELPSEQVRKVFSYLHEVKAKIEKDSESVQLYLTEGVLTQSFETFEVRHPLIYKEVGIELIGETDEPEILVTKSNSESSIYVTILRFLEVNGSTLYKLKDDFNDLEIDPDDNKIDLFLKKLIHSLWKDGKFSEEKVPPSQRPTLFLELKLLLGKKESQFAEQIDNYIEKIKELGELPLAYQNMVGHFEIEEERPPAFPEEIRQRTAIPPKKRDYFLTKEYNIEQKKIINVLEDYGCVSVQGPPGTGKSHTIANLIGHLLAKGESVLVSAYRSKALEVIRDQVVENVRPLCVSILDDQKKNKEQLQGAVNYLEELTTKNNKDQLAIEINELKLKRDALVSKASELEREFSLCIMNEYRPIPFQGQAILPKDAAVYINENKEKVVFYGELKGDVLALNREILAELKIILRSVGVNAQNIIEKEVPNWELLISSNDLKFLMEENNKFKDKKSKVREEEYSIFKKLNQESLSSIAAKIEDLFSFFEANKEEYLEAMLDYMMEGESYADTFNKFVNDCAESIKRINDWRHLVFEHDPKLDSEHDIDALIKCAENLYDTSDKEVKFSFFAKLFNTEMKIINEEARVHGRELRTKEEIHSVVNLLKIKREREFLKGKWNNLMTSRLNAPASEEFKKVAEDEISYRLISINRTLQYKELLDTISQDLSDLNIELFGNLYEEIKFKTQGRFQNYDSTREVLHIKVRLPVGAALEEKRVGRLNIELKKSLDYLKKFANKSEFNQQIFNSLNSLNYYDYGKRICELEKLCEQSKLVNRLKEISIEIAKVAPDFSRDLEKRSLDNVILEIDDLETCWKSSYLDFILSKRNAVDPMKIQDTLVGVKDNLKRLDSVLIQKLSIQGLLHRIGPRQRQALRGFVVAQNKMTKSGRGVRDAVLRKEARSQMKECRSAVPVWIMPLSKVMDNFVIGEDAFDVLIIDEASQADITNIPIFSMAKKVIVVGDDKQVSPSAAGISLAGVDELINEYLQGIPNKAIYDYKASLYDIACSSFGETIRLSEHFRCTPEIIQFCNDLQYQGGIKALRESDSNPTPPSIVPFFVEGHMDESKKNHEEAIKIASIIAAMTKNSLYQNASIGVISLSGYQQHQYIDSLLRSVLSTVAYEKHKIICGKAPQFQGDERNIIFLTLVDSPTSEGPLRKKTATDAIKKEYNVAVSRAKDQLWVVHSMNMETHLQPDDIRLRLLKHAKDPRDLMEKYSHMTSLAESPFELSVHKDLLRENYKFVPQYQVGAYRIDIVLFTSDGKRIALECDGEKFHHTEEQVKNDLQRQEVLERLHFVFIRIRGSDYYRRREETLDKLYRRLDELKAVKGGNEVEKEKKVEVIDSNLLVEAERFRMEIENLLQDGEIESLAPSSFNQRWSSGTKKKNSRKDEVKSTKEEVEVTFTKVRKEEKAIIDFPPKDSIFKYIKFSKGNSLVDCWSCGKQFEYFKNGTKNTMSFGYYNTHSDVWFCKTCFKRLKEKNGWKT